MERRVRIDPSAIQRPSILDVRARDHVYRPDLPSQRVKILFRMERSGDYKVAPSIFFPNFHSLPLSSGSSARFDKHGNKYFLDHTAQSTSWSRPAFNVDEATWLPQEYRRIIWSQLRTYPYSRKTREMVEFGLSIHIQGQNVCWPLCIDNLSSNPPVQAPANADFSQVQIRATSEVITAIKHLTRDDFPSSHFRALPPSIPAYSPDFDPTIPFEEFQIELSLSSEHYRLKPAGFFPTYIQQPLGPRYEMSTDRHDRPYFLDHRERSTSWERPEVLIPNHLRAIVQSSLNLRPFTEISRVSEIDGIEWHQFSIPLYRQNAFLHHGGANDMHEPGNVRLGLNPLEFHRIDPSNIKWKQTRRILDLIESFTGSESPYILSLSHLNAPRYRLTPNGRIYLENNRNLIDLNDETSDDSTSDGNRSDREPRAIDPAANRSVSSSEMDAMSVSFRTISVRESSLSTLTAESGSENGEAHIEPMDVQAPGQLRPVSPPEIPETPRTRRRRVDRERQARCRARRREAQLAQDRADLENPQRIEVDLGVDEELENMALERRRLARAAEDDEEAANRRASQREMMQNLRAAEPQEVADERREENRDQHRRARANIARLHRAAFEYDPDVPIEQIIPADLLTIGPMNEVCVRCNAKRFKGESKGFCCSDGKVRVPEFPAPPPEFDVFFGGERPEHRQFMERIRTYNSRFAMTSFACQRVGQGWDPCFRIQGQVYHRIGPARHPEGQQPNFIQIYFLGEDEQLERRVQAGQQAGQPELNRETLQIFQSLLVSRNRLVSTFIMSMEREPLQDASLIMRSERGPDAPLPQGAHPGRFNAPTVPETALLIVTSNREPTSREVRLYPRSGPIQRINEMFIFYDALQYPLILWQGSATYTFDEINQRNADGSINARKFVTTRQYYCYLTQVRDSVNNNFLLRCGHLFSQFIVDMWAKAEAERLRFLRTHQAELRVADYIDLRDALEIDGDLRELGRRVILPSTFIGGPRNLQEYIQDAMAIVRVYGKPSLFITMTCNPRWAEIAENLFEGQTAPERHDIVARVFDRKVKQLIRLLMKGEIFGTAKAYVYSIEWQKRGLPHVHLLLWTESALRTDDIDAIISAEIPDLDIDPDLYQLVRRHMVHGPCGNFNPTCPCMQRPVGEGFVTTCSKRFPKDFAPQTIADRDGYPHYQRRSPDQGGLSFELIVRNQRINIDNSWIVPYSPLLLRIFKTHINVEYCHSVSAIKYLFKYINKGTDMSMFRAEAIGGDAGRVDEIARYETARYLSAGEAVWKFFSFAIHGRDPPIQHLEVHLENYQRTYFNPDQNPNNIAPRRTTLTSFFELCTENPDETRNLLYLDVPHDYTYNRDVGFRRRVNLNVYQIGRMYTVHPNVGECYYLRLLLSHRRGPQSFEDIRTVDDVPYRTYREACQALNLLDDDTHLIAAMRDACRDRPARHCRELFAIILTFSEPNDPLAMWEEFRSPMCDDLILEAGRLQRDLTEEQIHNECLIRLEDLTLSINGRSFGNLPGQIPLPSTDRDQLRQRNSEIRRETAYDQDDMLRFCEANVSRLTSEQKAIYDRVTRAILRGIPKIFFLDAPGGTGKTFLLNCILAKIRSERKIILASAASGIAATLLAGGKTAHSMFGIPINHQQVPMCSIARNSYKAELFRKTSAIIWDECTMSDKRNVEAVNRTMQDIRGDDQLFGGLVVLFSGDFRQCLPVVREALGPAEAIEACLKRSVLWQHFETRQLTRNMRVAMSSDQAGAAEFAALLLRMGNAHIPYISDAYEIRIGSDLCQLVTNIDQLIDAVFPDINSNLNTPGWICSRAILAPVNTTVDGMNSMIQSRLDGTHATRTYFSIDTCMNIDQAANFPVENLNRFEISNFPTHRLELRIGSPIMMLRNLSPPKLCNGTRLQVTALRPNLIVAKILTGPGAGSTVMIPRIKLISDDDFVVKFCRRQFPVRLAYAMTINKAQGQTMDLAGINLYDEPCFSHGQLYVACSRVRSRSNLFILTRENKTKNVVYPEVL